MAKRKHDPFFTHLWDELLGAKLLQNETVARWIDLPTKLQAQFVEAAQRAMNAALGAPAKPRRPARKAAAPKSKAKAKAKTKTKPKARKAAKKG
ncbi:MAG TPA: hypothetical protein VHA35_16465 [Dongiaceae bacterium]|nr:hypothetical protein [Dongiaceae bacterium]